MFNFDSINEPILYILTLNKNVITEDYMKKEYFSSLFPKYANAIDKETGEKAWLPTKFQSTWDHDLEFSSDRWDVGKTLHSLTSKTYFCIAEYGDQIKTGKPYIDIINDAFKKIVKNNLEKYDLSDVSEGLKLPIDKHWRDNTGEEKPYVGYMDRRIKGTLTGWMRDNNITIQEFLKNPRYILFLDSDFVNILESVDNYNMISDKIDEIYCV